MLQNMDTTVDPCEDFYSFSCGGWSKVNIIPDDKARFGAFSQVWIRGSRICLSACVVSALQTPELHVQLYDRNEILLKSLLESTSVATAAKLGTTKALNFYHSCMDTAQIETVGAFPIKSMYDRVAWTTTDMPLSNHDYVAIAETLATLHRMGVGGLFGLSVGADDKNSTRNVVQVLTRLARHPALCLCRRHRCRRCRPLLGGGADLPGWAEPAEQGILHRQRALTKSLMSLATLPVSRSRLPVPVALRIDAVYPSPALGRK